jgi:hypothetical protein
MVENTKKTFLDNQKDYYERFEFKFTVGANIICQRYFKINNFNPLAYASTELPMAIETCGRMIDRDLKDKTAVYLALSAPQTFQNEKEMESFYEKEQNKARMTLGEGIVLKHPNTHDYAWNGKQPKLLTEKFDSKGEFTNPLVPEDWVEYKLAFCDNGREVCSYTWTGCYPKAVRNTIDLSNKRAKINPDDINGIKFDTYLLYKMSEDKQDIVYKIIKEICTVCAYPDEWYTTVMSFKNSDGTEVVYDNQKFVPEIVKQEIKRRRKV